MYSLPLASTVGNVLGSLQIRLDLVDKIAAQYFRPLYFTLSYYLNKNQSRKNILLSSKYILFYYYEKLNINLNKTHKCNVFVCLLSFHAKSFEATLINLGIHIFLTMEEQIGYFL